MSFHFPWYGGGGSVDAPPIYGGDAVAIRPIPFTVSLNGIEYPIELEPYRRRSLDTQTSGGNVQSTQPDDSQFNSEGAWWRYVYDWSMGTGQLVQDFGKDVLPNRFHHSIGIDPWEEFCAKLHQATIIKQTAAAANVLLIATGIFVYMSDGAIVKRSSDLTTWTVVTGLTGTIRDFSTDGSTVYIATSTHVHGCNDGGAAAATVITTTGGDYQKVGFVANRLLAASDNVIYSIASGGARTAIPGGTHFQTAFRWTAIFNIGSRIYFGGFAGNRTELYSATTDSSGNLVASAEAAQFPYNELLRCAVSYGGAALIGTSLGVRLATLSGDGSLTYGPLLDGPGDVHAITAEGRFAWFGWEGFFGIGSGLGRLALDQTVKPLQPAYATDVYTTEDVDVISGVCRFGGKTVFAVAGTGVFATTTSYVHSGFVESGQVYLGTIEPKAITAMSVRCDPLEDAETVTVEVEDDQGDSMGSFLIDSDGAVGVEAALDGDRAAWVQVHITLTGDGTSTPCLRSWRLRGFPIVPTVEEWIVPLIIHSYVVVNDGSGQLKSFHVLTEIESLIEAKKSQSVILYREGARTYRVRIDKYEMQPREWTDTSDFFEALFVVRLLSV